MEEGNSLIPGLPNELAISCLIRVPGIYHHSMKDVNSQWRSLILDPYSTFHTQRKLHGFTNPTLFLFSIHDNHLYLNSLKFTEIDLASGKKSIGFFENESVREIIIFLEGHACISHGALLIVLGGFGPERASNSVHLLDTASKEWTVGANMLSRRGKFAWGLIGNRLYVAGGFGGTDVGNIAAAEVYDFEANEWSEVSSMPVSMVIDVFFVVSGKLFVRGRVPQRNAVEGYLYCPVRNEWEEEKWMIRVLEPVGQLTENKFAITVDGNDIYRVELSEAFHVWGLLTERLFISISKLNNETLEWVRVSKIMDRAESDFCRCSDNDRQVPFHCLNDGDGSVMLLCHEDTDSDTETNTDYDEDDISHVSPGVLKVSVPCTNQYVSAVVSKVVHPEYS